MSRQSKGARLWLEPERRNDDGSIRKRAVWVIRDGTRKISTGKAKGDRQGAELALAEYITRQYRPERAGSRRPNEILIADVISMWLEDVASKLPSAYAASKRALALDAWWGNRTLAEVTGKTCREYVEHRVGQPYKNARPEVTGNPARTVTAACARRELEDLRAAINYHRREGLCSEIVSVVLPPPPPPRDRWLTRSEAARLLWAARRRPHVARFILIGLYTGTRSKAICGAALMPTIGRGYVDLERGVFYRRPSGEQETNKRKSPVRLPPRLLAHLRRWQRLGIAKRAVVEWNGKPVQSVRSAWGTVVGRAGLRGVTPHVLRHTCATWLMQNRADKWDAAGFLGMTINMLERVYGHHHPDHQASAVAALGRQNGDRNNENKARQAAPSVVNFSK